MFADPENVKADLVGELDGLEQIAQALFGAELGAGLRIGWALDKREEADLERGRRDRCGLGL
jgi:hypothetical protein